MTIETIAYVYVLSLTILIIVQMVAIHKLINKLMSRSYHDYEFSKHVSETMKQPEPSLKEGLRHEEGLREDLSPVESIVTGVF